MKSFLSAKKIALCAIMTATLEIGKLSLSFIANVEVVSLLTAVYAYVFGGLTLISVLAFILIEMAIWGVNTWVLSYFVFYGSIAIVFYFLGKKKIDILWLILLLISILTASFGFVSSFFDVAIGGFNNFLNRYFIYYFRGIVFYAVHVVSNFIIFLLTFKSVKKLLENIKLKFFVENHL